MLAETVDLRILGAMENLWARILQVRDFARQFTFFQSILLPIEYGDVLSGKAKGIVPRISRQEFDSQTVNLVAQIEAIRPLVGETIWSLFGLYTAFSIRQALKVQDGLDKGKLYEWNKDFHGEPDSYMQRMIRSIFTEEELSQIHADKSLGATTAIMTAIEIRILNEMNKWIFEREFHSPDIKQQQVIQNLLNVMGDLNVGGDIVGRDKTISG